MRTATTDAARRAADWLVEQQAKNGAVGVTSTQATPCWPTSLAILLWQAIGDRDQYGEPIGRAVDWTLHEQGETHEQRPYVGHDTTLVGWSWAAHTHSWLEPTAMFVLALKAVGQSQHPRTREAVRLLVDRLLPHGGCNYGNTIVLGQELLPHVQPTGIVMMALADEQITDPRIELSLKYLEQRTLGRHDNRLAQLRPVGSRGPRPLARRSTCLARNRLPAHDSARCRARTNSR